MSAADRFADTMPTAPPADAPTAVPTPVAGAGSADLVTESDDPVELRALLERARERLSFYESFDRIIGENLRRTGEMMAETVALREQAARAVRDREAIDLTIRDERERHRDVLESALAEVRNAQPVIDAMVDRLQGALKAISASEGTPEKTPGETLAPKDETMSAQTTPEMAEEASADRVASPPVPAPEEDVPEAAPTAEPALPSSIEVLAHGVPSATTAIGLQAMLRELEVVTNVEAREFADGELRLHVECAGPITDDSFKGWLSKNGGSLVSRSAKAIELSFG